MQIDAAESDVTVRLFAARSAVEAAQAAGANGGCDLRSWMPTAIKIHGMTHNGRVVRVR
jgi:hypothetical protein